MRIPSENDKAVYEAVKQYEGSMSAAVKHVAMERGYKVPSVYGIINRVQKWLDSFDQDESPAVTPLDVIPQGQALKGVSSYLDADGNILRQWIRTDREQDSWAALIDAALEKASNLTPVDPIMPPTWTQAETLAVYPIADWHLGIKALNEDWPLDHAVATYREKFRQLVHSTRASERAVIAFMGDFTHADNDTNLTPRSGKKLDVSARYADVVQAAFQLVVDMIRIVAETHQDISVIYQSGNHDEATGIVMQAALKQMFKESPRLGISGQNRFHYVTFGENLIAFTHGHTVKRDDLPMIMATDVPEQWGRATNRVWHTGHIHHKTVQEYRGCTVESHNSPAPKDAWHSDSGYRSLRSMVSIVYDANGEVARHTIRIGS